jgi:hypothetical protein
MGHGSNDDGLFYEQGLSADIHDEKVMLCTSACALSNVASECVQTMKNCEQA